MFIATIVLSALLAVTFLGAGVPKVIGAKQSLQMRDQLRVGADLFRVIGVLEIAAAVGLVAGLAVPVLGIAAADWTGFASDRRNRGSCPHRRSEGRRAGRDSACRRGGDRSCPVPVDVKVVSS